MKQIVTWLQHPPLVQHRHLLSHCCYCYYFYYSRNSSSNNWCKCSSMSNLSSYYTFLTFVGQEVNVWKCYFHHQQELVHITAWIHLESVPIPYHISPIVVLFAMKGSNCDAAIFLIRWQIIPLLAGNIHILLLFCVCSIVKNSTDRHRAKDSISNNDITSLFNAM